MRVENGGTVRAEFRDEVIRRVEENFVSAGAKDYDDGMRQFAKLLEFVTQNFDPMRTKEQFAAALDELPQPSFLQARLFLGALSYLRQIIRYGLKKLAETAEDNLPAIPTGRPGLLLQEKVRIVDFVGDQFKHMHSLAPCIKRAAKRFGVSESTVQRAWDDRTNMD